jgi:hypothetical protein
MLKALRKFDLPMTKKELYAHPGWQSCTFEGAELHTLLLGLQSTFREKLEWLEQVEELGINLQSSRWKKGLPVDPRLRPALEAIYGAQPKLARKRHPTSKNKKRRS